MKGSELENLDSPSSPSGPQVIRAPGDSPADPQRTFYYRPVEGESGTGKELVARQLHEISRRRHGPFMAVTVWLSSKHCPKPSSSGSKNGRQRVRGRRGKFEHADGGSLFLDEVSDLSLSPQAKLLRAIQELAVERRLRASATDRGGDGWSEMGRYPRTFKQIVYELHTLLDRAGEWSPYVMVGQSSGGWLVRTYRTSYPSAVAGIVLVDAGENDPERLMPDGSVGRASMLAKGTPIPPIKTSGPLRIANIPTDALTAMRRGIAASVPHANDPPRQLLPDDAKKMRTWALAQIGHLIAGVNPVEVEEIALLRKERMDNPHVYGDMPLIVITRGRPESDSTPPREEERRAAHKAIASSSSRGRWLIAERSGHHVQIERPEVVVAAIKELVKELVLGAPSK